MHGTERLQWWKQKPYADVLSVDLLGAETATLVPEHDHTTQQEYCCREFRDTSDGYVVDKNSLVSERWPRLQIPNNCRTHGETSDCVQKQRSDERRGYGNRDASIEVEV